MTMKRPHIQDQHGVTFVEMLLTMGLLIMFLVITTTLFTAAIDTQNEGSAYSATLADSRFIMARLNYDIAQSTAISTPATLGTPSSTLVMTVGGSTYTYALNSGNLQLTDGTGPALLNSDGSTVSGLSFVRLGNTGGKETIRYTFTITSTGSSNKGAETETLTSTVERR